MAGVTPRHGVQPPRHDDARQAAVGDDVAHHRRVDAEAYALDPHVGDEFVEVQARRLRRQVRHLEEHRFEIVFGLAVDDLDGFVQATAQRVERLRCCSAKRSKGWLTHVLRQVGPQL
jgi:hypothetical protein